MNGTEYFRKTIAATGPLDAQVLYLGGQPQLRPVRQATENFAVVSRNDVVSSTGPAASTTPLSMVHFKGIIQDVQVIQSFNFLCRMCMFFVCFLVFWGFIFVMQLNVSLINLFFWFKNHCATAYVVK